jgi:hypothetical protein
MLDRLPAAARHLLFLLLPVLLAWASSDLLPVLEGQFPEWGMIWAVVTQALLWATPLTRQYGAGSGKPGAHEDLGE